MIAALSRKTYVDGPPASTFFGALNDLVGCVICPASFCASICPRALMKSDDRIPIMDAASLMFFGGCSWSSVRPCRSSRLVALAKLEPVNLLCEHFLRRRRLPYAFANISVRKLSPVFIIARDPASLVASAT